MRWLACVACMTCTKPLQRSPVLEVAVGDRPAALAAGDIDGDGEVDLISANGDGTLSVSVQSAGSWRALPAITPPAALHMIALVDLDRDGDLDVVGTAHDSGAVFVGAGDRKGGFAFSAITAVSTAKPHNHGLVVGDLDGDGDDDVVVADQTGATAVTLRNDGLRTPCGSAARPGKAGACDRGQLAVAATLALGGEAYPPALGDLNRDGRLDLVVPLIGGQSVGVWLGDGAGGFAQAPGSPHRTRDARPYAATVLDLDRDGDLDVVAPHDDTDHVSVLLGDGSGRLVDAPASPISFGKRVWRPVAADVDGDGDLDVAGVGEGTLVIARGDGRGGLAPAMQWGVGWSIVAADIDRDGVTDLVAPDLDRDVLVIWRGPR